MTINTQKNVLLALTSGVLLGLPWSVPDSFLVVFIAWLPLLWVEAQVRQQANPYAVFNYALISFLLCNIIGTWWIVQAHAVGAILIICANALVQALVFWLASRVRCILRIPFAIPFLIIWMGYEHFHLAWDLAWPWLNLGNALATAPRLIQWFEFTGVRGGTLWIILSNLAAFKLLADYRQNGPGVTAGLVAAALILLAVPAGVSHLIFESFEAPGERINIALIQPNLDPYTEKFDPKNYARHLTEFYKTAEAIVDENTQFLFGPETLIVEQIDESNPSASAYYRDLLAFRKQYPTLSIIVGVHSYRKLGKNNIPPGSRFDRKKKLLRSI